MKYRVRYLEPKYFTYVELNIYILTLVNWRINKLFFFLYIVLEVSIDFVMEMGACAKLWGCQKRCNGVSASLKSCHIPKISALISLSCFYFLFFIYYLFYFLGVLATNCLREWLSKSHIQHAVGNWRWDPPIHKLAK